MNRHKMYWCAMGSTRKPEEIFAGIERRNQEREAQKARLSEMLDDIMRQDGLISHEGKIDLIRETVCEFLERMGDA